MTEKERAHFDAVLKQSERFASYAQEVEDIVCNTKDSSEAVLAVCIATNRLKEQTKKWLPVHDAAFNALSEPEKDPLGWTDDLRNLLGDG